MHHVTAKWSTQDSNPYCLTLKLREMFTMKLMRLKPWDPHLHESFPRC